MSTRRGYQLVCPVARALDRVGDRWSLLILRDLHAGPARFGELEDGLGVASNLLSSRLRDLVADGLVDRDDDRRYRLTAAGRQTDRVLFELAQLGVTYGRDEDLREPGNLRSIVVPLRTRLADVSPRPSLVVELTVDDEPFTIDTTGDEVEMRVGPADDPDVRVRATYEGLLATAEGQIGAAPIDVVDGDDERAREFLALLRTAFALPA